MLGASGVGKSALCTQFLSSEHSKERLKNDFGEYIVISCGGDYFGRLVVTMKKLIKRGKRNLIAMAM